MEGKKDLPKVYIYLHPDGKQFLFSPAELNTSCPCLEVYGFTDEVLNENYADEKNAEGWFSGRSISYLMDRLFEQGAKQQIGNDLSDILKKSKIETSELF